MSSGGVDTRVDKPYNQHPDTRAAARRYIQKHAPDLIDVLGLDDTDDTVMRRTCPVCAKPVPGTGRCRRTDKCRQPASTPEPTDEPGQPRE